MLLFLHRSEKRSIGLDKDGTRRDATPRRAAPSSTKRKRLKLKATVENDGAPSRERRRAHLLFAIRTGPLVHFASLFFLFISCPSSLSPCAVRLLQHPAFRWPVSRSCLKYPLRYIQFFLHTYLYYKGTRARSTKITQIRITIAHEGKGLAQDTFANTE